MTDKQKITFDIDADEIQDFVTYYIHKLCKREGFDPNSIKMDSVRITPQRVSMSFDPEKAIEKLNSRSEVLKRLYYVAILTSSEEIIKSIFMDNFGTLDIFPDDGEYDEDTDESWKYEDDDEDEPFAVNKG